MSKDKCPRCPKCDGPLLPGSINCGCGWRAESRKPEHGKNGWCAWHDEALSCPLPATHRDGHEGAWLCRYHVQHRVGMVARRIAECAHARLAKYKTQGASERKAIEDLYYTTSGMRAIAHECHLEPDPAPLQVRHHISSILRKLGQRAANEEDKNAAATPR